MSLLRDTHTVGDPLPQSLRPVLEGEHVVINAETGSGKTLCEPHTPQAIVYHSMTTLTAGYLLPVLQALHQLRGQGVKSLPCPHSVVLVPTPDLAVQVHRL